MPSPPPTRLEDVRVIWEEQVVPDANVAAKLGSFDLSIDTHENRPTQPYRPLNRPPMAMLCLLDDGCWKGEWFRIRSTPFYVGRCKETR